ncbi:MAG: hypothetical protein KG003_00495 [Bacteroidetes bacterium]|nr:hypothetical protein [Bacteroidota bacterium]
MKTTHFGIVTAALILSFSVACKKEKTETPKATGVVFCKVNGTYWECGQPNKTVNVDGKNYYMNYATIANDKLTISGIRKDTDTSGIYFYDVQLKSGWVGTVNGTTDAYTGGMYMKRYDIDNLINVLGNYNVVYEISITSKDVTNKTISGNFIINMTSKTGSGNVTVSEGEFINLKYK